jgi:RsiW-degrading membrane proteinase PrsW (M82 family)
VRAHRLRYRDIDAGSTINLAEGPFTAAGSWMRWESLQTSVLNVLVVVLVVAIVAVWSLRVDAHPLPVRTRHSADEDDPYLACNPVTPR